LMSRSSKRAPVRKKPQTVRRNDVRGLHLPARCWPLARGTIPGGSECRFPTVWTDRINRDKSDSTALTLLLQLLDHRLDRRGVLALGVQSQVLPVGLYRLSVLLVLFKQASEQIIENRLGVHVLCDSGAVFLYRLVGLP